MEKKSTTVFLMQKTKNAKPRKKRNNAILMPQ